MIGNKPACRFHLSWRQTRCSFRFSLCFYLLAADEPAREGLARFEVDPHVQEGYEKQTSKSRFVFINVCWGVGVRESVVSLMFDGYLHEAALARCSIDSALTTDVELALCPASTAFCSNVWKKIPFSYQFEFTEGKWELAGFENLPPPVLHGWTNCAPLGGW